MITKCRDCTKYTPNDHAIFSSATHLGATGTLSPCKFGVITQVDMDEFGCTHGVDKHDLAPYANIIDCVESARIYWDRLDEALDKLISRYDDCTAEGQRIIADVETVRKALTPIRATFDRATEEIE